MEEGRSLECLEFFLDTLYLASFSKQGFFFFMTVSVKMVTFNVYMMS